MLNKPFLSLMVWFLLVTGMTACSFAPDQDSGSGAASAEAAATPGQDHDAEAEESHAEYEEEMAVHLEALAPANLAAGEKLRVVATTNIIGDIVRQVGGDSIELTVILPPGTDPHTFEPAPRDLTTVADADLVFANGLGLEGFLKQMIDNAGGEAVVIPVSQGIEPRALAEAESHAEEEAGHEAESHAEEEADHEDDEHEDHGDIDPHTWTSPANALIFVENIVQALSAMDPAKADTYAANGQAYHSQLVELDGWVQAQIDTIPAENRKLVSDHASFGYYAERYGLTQVGAVIPSFNTNAEPSAQALAALEDVIIDQGVKAVFVGNTVNPALSEQVAKDTGASVLRLYTGSLGADGSGVETYLDYIRYNTETIVSGLK